MKLVCLLTTFLFGTAAFAQDKSHWYDHLDQYMAAAENPPVNDPVLVLLAQATARYSQAKYVIDNPLLTRGEADYKQQVDTELTAAVKALNDAIELMQTQKPK